MKITRGLTKAIWICSLGSLFYVYDFLVRVVPGTIAPDLMIQYNLTSAGLGLLSGLFFLGYMLMQIPCGLLYDHYGARKLLTITAFIAAIATLFFVATHNVIIAAFARFFMGASSAFAYIGALFLASRWLPVRYFALTAALIQVMGSIGAIIGQGPLAQLVYQYGAYLVTIWIAGLGLVLALLFWVFLRDYPEDMHTKFAPVEAGSVMSYLHDVTSNRQNWAIALYAFTIWGSICSFGALWAIPFFMEKYQLTGIEAATLTSFIWVGVAIGGPIFSTLSNYWMSRRKPLIYASLLGIIASLCVVYLPRLSITSLSLFLLLFGAAGSAQAVTFGLVQDNNSLQRTGTASGLNNMAIVLGGTLLQPLIGLLLRQHEKLINGLYYYSQASFHFALVILPICFTISLIIVLFFINETHCQHSAEATW